jgi:hypothetical protein
VKDRTTDYDIIGTRPPKPARVDDLPMFAPPVSRASDPTTSHAAEKRMASRDAIIRRVVEAHADAGPHGMTADECAAVIGIDGAWKRCSDAVAMGYLWENGDARSGRSGRAQVVRVITAHGLALLARKA